MTPRKPVLVHVTTVPQTLLFLRSQMTYMKSRGFRVVAVSSPGPVLEELRRTDGIETFELAMPRRITPLGDLMALIRLVLFFRRLKPDLVHGHTPKGGLLGMLAAALAGVRGRVYTLHGLPLETARGWRRTLLRLTEKVSCALARRVTAVSESLRERTAALGIARRERLRVLAAGTVNGVDAETRFSPAKVSRLEAARLRRVLAIPSELRVVGFVGRVVRDKGVQDLLRAWEDLREEFPDLHLLVIGPEEPQDPLPPQAAHRLRSDPRIRLAGSIESMPAAYSLMDVVVLPSYREGFPQVPLEAGGMGKPVVATRVTGCVDAIECGRTGTLVAPGDPERLRDAIRQYLEDPALRQRHGAAARGRVLREFRPERLWLHTWWEYESLLGLRKTAPRKARPRRRGRPPIDALLKRLIDLAGAAAGLVALSPLLGLLSLLILAFMGRPIFFRQKRPGLRGAVFTLLKFRSMRDGPEPDEERLGRLGRFLRSFSLDELPQLWNVVVGQMSLVGPRPLRVEYLPLYSPEEARRHEVRPGLTGAAQVHGRNGLSWPEKFALDRWYVDNGSLRVDLQILLRTIERVLSRSGINGPGNASVPLFQGTIRTPEGSFSPERGLSSGWAPNG